MLTITFSESKLEEIWWFRSALTPITSKHKDILTTLRHLRVKENQLANSPFAIRQLNQGGLDIIPPLYA